MVKTVDRIDISNFVEFIWADVVKGYNAKVLTDAFCVTCRFFDGDSENSEFTSKVNRAIKILDKTEYFSCNYTTYDRKLKAYTVKLIFSKNINFFHNGMVKTVYFEDINDFVKFILADNLEGYNVDVSTNTICVTCSFPDGNSANSKFTSEVSQAIKILDDTKYFSYNYATDDVNNDAYVVKLVLCEEIQAIP